MMLKWLNKFWMEHGERLVFLFLAYMLALFLWFFFEMKGEAKAIFVGAPMMLFNKARSPDEAIKADPLEVRGGSES